MRWGRRKGTQGFLVALNPTAGDAREIELNKPECSVGTDESNDLIIHDGSVSRRHAQIRQHRNKWQVLDRQSTNGTYIGDRKATRWITLRDGQELRLGAARFIFQRGPTFSRGSSSATSTHQVRHSRLRLVMIVIPIGLIVGFAAVQYFFYRSYQRQEALLHNSLPKR